MTKATVIVTWLQRLDTLALLLHITTRADAHMAAFSVDTLLVFFGAYGLWQGTLINIWRKQQCGVTSA